MIKTLLTSSVALLLILASGTVVQANELDNEQGAATRQLQGTVILRVDKRTNRLDYIKTDKTMKSKEQANKTALGSKYKSVPSSRARSELDQDGGSSSWYFYGNYYYYPNCYWYGYYYNPYYYYSWGPYNYYYYGSYWWW